MFYSQFILAKKGPLGTIWIAAHLERKLRKNQVADTDIGVSVDSILFPEVPIALRLSSHLLLGVVRIYSKKVNYLFHDCSEALLNIKQAFRSTAVDLPPEESTAPYHSITLPETFDLDDFELPDNGLFEGNFVDHHISSREQITLQDSLNGMAYLTSQFGPDERFGDGDASQLGLEIDENLFVDKVQTPLDPTDLLAPEEHEEPEVFGQTAATLSEMDIDEPVVQDGMHGQPVQSPDLNNALPSEPIEADPNVVEGICPVKSPSSESAQAPSTPGLLQEAIPANFHDGPTLSPLRKMSPSNNVEGLMPDDGGVAHLENDPECKKPETNNGLIHSLESDSCMVDQNHAMDLGGNLSASDNDMSNSVQGGPELVNPILGSDTRNLPLDDQTQSVDSLQEFHRVDLPPDSLDSVPQSSRCMDNVEDVEDPNPSWRMLQPCSSLLKEADALPAGDNELVGAFDSENAPLDVQGGRKSSANVMDAHSESAQMLKSSLAGMDADFDKADVPPKDAQLEILNHETNSNLLPPESFVSAPPIVVEVPIDVVPLSGEVEIANAIEKGDESFGDFTGKKRKVMESTPVLQNDDSAKLSGVPRSKKSVGFIPNDDDVLASILVGRRTPSWKLRPTPPTVEATSSKRTRLMPRTSVSKRKVLVDDTMVMHGDVIRQQLTNTEDIRRVRRKAPCTRIEFWMIEKSFLEDEMFTESVFSGVSSEVSSLLNREYDVIENTEFSRNAEAVLEANVQQNDSSLAVPSERSNGEVHQLCAISSPNDKQTNECDSNPLPLDAQDQVETKTGSFTLDSLENCHSLDLTASGKEAQHCGNADTAEHMDSQVNDISCSITEKLVVETFDSFAELNDENLDARVDKVAITGEENNECTESGADNVAITGAELNDENLNASVDKETITEKENSECTEVRANVTGEENGKCAFQVEIDTTLITNDALITEYRKAADSFDALQPLLQEDRNASGETKFEISSGPNMPRDSSSTVENVDHTRPEDVDMEVGELPEYATKGVDAVNVGETSEEKHCSSPTCPNEPEMDREKHSPDNKELPGIQEIGQEGDMAVQMLSEAGTNNLSPMFEENNTEFLNVDDEAEPVEEEDNYTSTEQDQFFENSGWSSRTRAVARYLKSLFDNEVGHGRKVVAVDNLLAGKTRKEASRMFFETLVLKTKDYIQVEQDNSFGNINIKPRGKLVKSDF